MQPPLEVQNLCQSYLEKIRQTPEHKLLDNDRLELYLKFGHSRILYNTTSIKVLDFTIADIALAWLAFLTAKKVGFICKRAHNPYEFDISEADEVKEILRAAQAYLNKRMNFEDAANVLQEYWYFFRPHLTYDVLCAWRASMNALDFILYGAQFKETVPGFDHFVIDAVEAYTVIDRNLPGEGDQPEPPIPLEYDISKRLRFWEWWLIEAIPQAWELVN